MTTRKNAKTAPPKKRAAPAKQPKTNARAEAVEKILLNVEKKMSKQDVRATLGDYIKLIQLSKEMTEAPKTEIKVTWIEEEPEPTGK